MVFAVSLKKEDLEGDTKQWLDSISAEEASSRLKRVCREAYGIGWQPGVDTVDDGPQEVTALLDQKQSFESFCRRYPKDLIEETKVKGVGPRILASLSSQEDLNHFCRLVSISIKELDLVIERVRSGGAVGTKLITIGAVAENVVQKKLAMQPVSSYEQEFLEKCLPELIDSKLFCQGVQYYLHQTGELKKVHEKRGRGRIKNTDCVESIIGQRWAAIQCVLKSVSEVSSKDAETLVAIMDQLRGLQDPMAMTVVAKDLQDKTGNSRWLKSTLKTVTELGKFCEKNRATFLSQWKNLNTIKSRSDLLTKALKGTAKLNSKDLAQVGS